MGLEKTHAVATGDFRHSECPPCSLVFVDPPYGLGKSYDGVVETTPYEEWVDLIHQWANRRCGWLVVLGPYPTMRLWLPKVGNYILD